MTLSDFALKELMLIVAGETGITNKLSGPDLVELFNRFGQKDIYSFKDGGLPKLGDSEQSPGRKDYAFDRLKRMNKTKKLKELVEFRINDNMSDKLIDIVNSIINDENLRVEVIEGKAVIIGHEKYADDSPKEVKFEDIQQSILDELSRAKFIIYVAVAWLTDPVLFKKLVDKKAEGVNIQVIISDDEINKTSGLHFEAHFETTRIKPFGYFGNNLMHNKFCVIDLRTVISGSYNWSKKAQYNNENITLDHNRELAEKFAEQFIKIKYGKA